MSVFKYYVNFCANVEWLGTVHDEYHETGRNSHPVNPDFAAMFFLSQIVFHLLCCDLSGKFRNSV